MQQRKDARWLHCCPPTDPMSNHVPTNDLSFLENVLPTADIALPPERSSGKGLAVGIGIAGVALIALIVAFVFFILPQSSGSLAALQSSAHIAIDKNSLSDTLPTHWSVTLDVSDHPGATVEPAVVSFDLGMEPTALPYALQDNMRFTGWYTEPNGGGTLIENNTLFQLTPDTNITLYASFEAKPTSLDYDTWGLPILMYHYFYDPDAGETGEDANWMDINLLHEQLAWLQENNYYYPSWEEVNEYIRGNIMLPKNSIVLCSDDGFPSYYELALPLVTQYGAKMTTFVVLHDFDQTKLTMYDPNHAVIQSHSYDMHRGGTDGDARILTASRAEIIDDVEKGAAILGTRIVYCLPFGKANANAKAALDEAGVGVVLAIENERAYPMEDPMFVPRLRMNDGVSLRYFIQAVSPD